MSRILCCIFNYNDNAHACEWANRLSPCFDTLILDSGSHPRCEHPCAVALDNLYYSGLMNEACRRAVEGNYPWVMVVTSDIQIQERDVPALVAAMEQISYSENVGLYQPSTAWKGRSLPQSRCHFTGKMRPASFQEGWFHLMRTDLLQEVCPIDRKLNLFGWGIDLALSHCARLRRLLILVDDRIRVVHPAGTGYNKEEALRQMRAWHASLPGYTSPRHFRPLNEPVRYRGRRLLVHLHLYYQEQISYFLEKLGHIEGVDWDLYVTSPGVLPEALKAEVRACNPDTVFLQTENIGYDIWPFVCVLRAVDLSRYQWVMKLHTKGEDHHGYTINGLHLKAFTWRDYLVDALLGSPAQFRRCLGLFDADPYGGMVFERALLRRVDHVLPEEGEMLDQELARLGLSRDYTSFCAGTIFMARARALHSLRDSDLTAQRFSGPTNPHGNGSLAHVYERIICFLIQDSGYRIRTLTRHPASAAYVRITKSVEPFLRRIFTLQYESPSGDKVLTLFGHKFIIKKGE